MEKYRGYCPYIKNKTYPLPNNTTFFNMFVLYSFILSDKINNCFKKYAVWFP
ncbi:Uncharacterized protein dnl_64220 [Desulfonema limicola]|uniref:Uncharacterized protein n=1 Tax=Desulfonema limicola TaxID=45656 RepID=A0A975BEE4_9BACT|nr:Uncharacterized protein dnl_64220 [Desulfonema limicola]